MDLPLPVLSYAPAGPEEDAGVVARRRTALARRAAVLSALLAVPALMCVPIGVVCVGVSQSAGQWVAGLAIAVLPATLFAINLGALGDQTDPARPHLPLLTISTAGELILCLLPTVLALASPADVPVAAWVASVYLLLCAGLSAGVLRDCLFLWRLSAGKF